MSKNTFQEKITFIKKVGDNVLKRSFKTYEYGDVIIPFIVLRRLDCVFEDKKDNVSASDTTKSLLKCGLKFYNTSRYDLKKLVQYPDCIDIKTNFWKYINGFSKNVYEIIEKFQIKKIISRLIENDILIDLIEEFIKIDLHSDKVSNHEMGSIFEEILRNFSEMSIKRTGEHYTPRNVIRLMVNVLFAEYKNEFKNTKSIFDPTCGTGGMLTVAKEYIKKDINPDAIINLLGQELNPQTFAIAKSDILIMGDNSDNIRYGNSLTEDKFNGEFFDYMLSNPPFGVNWKKEKEFIVKESKEANGRFSAGVPRLSDGSFLFLQHLISKMKPKPNGCRIAVILSGSPLFTGDAGYGENNIRKWIIENDWLEAIIALPTDMFFNTSIATYIWIITNKKPDKRKGFIQLINAVNIYNKMTKKLGNKKNYISEEQIKEITEIYTRFKEGDFCKIFANDFFGYTKVVVERPLKNKHKSDASLKDYEKIPLAENIDEYFEREVKPYIPDAWMDRSKDIVGYEISFTKYFYKYTPLRPLEEIKKDIMQLEEEIQTIWKTIF